MHRQSTNLSANAPDSRLLSVQRFMSAWIAILPLVGSVQRYSAMAPNALPTAERRWTLTKPFGVKWSVWASVAVVAVPVLGAAWFVVSKIIPPSLNITYPEQIQFECSIYVENPNGCVRESNVKFVVGNFGFWNDSIVSTRTELVKSVSAKVSIDYNNKSKFMSFDWTFFTEITVDPPKRDHAPVAVLRLQKNDYRDMEVEFYNEVDSRPEDHISWGALSDLIKSGLSQMKIVFTIELDYEGDKFVECHVKFGESVRAQLKHKDRHYFVTKIDCSERRLGTTAH